MHHSQRSIGGENEARRSRRDFLKASSLAVAAVAGGSAGALGQPARRGRGNSMPGRILLYRDPTMGGHLSAIDKERVAVGVARGVCILTGIDDPGAAFEALFPGLHPGIRIAIKVNCVGLTDTRWETVRGVVAGLALMLGGTYNVSQVAIYDRDSILGNGYPPGEFVFGGHQALLASGPDCSASYYVYGNHRLSNFLLDYDYVINMPSLKSHTYPNNQLTLAFKNHYGSCCPPSLCNDVTAMLSVNADSNIRDKTALVVMDGLRGTYHGGPTTPPMTWSTFPEGSPNTLFFSTDPVTNEYWGRDVINAERVTHGLAIKPAPWVEEASGAPYYLGVSDPEEMTVLNHDPATVDAAGAGPQSALFLAPNVPNPFRGSTLLRFHLPRAMRLRTCILDSQGRVVRRLAAGTFPAGHSQVIWDGRDDRGIPLPAGSYFAQLRAARPLATRRLQRLR